MKCDNEGERKEWKRKEKERKEKEKRKCWGREANGGGVAAAVAGGCTYTDERTVCKDTYLHYVGVVVMGGWGVYFGSDIDFGIYIPYIYASVSFRSSFCVFILCCPSFKCKGTWRVLPNPFSKRIRFSDFSQKQQHCHSNQNCDDDEAAHVVSIFSDCLQLQFKALYVSGYIQF